MTPDASFGRALRSLRDTRCVSQATLASRCGVTRTTLSQWENNRTLPRQADLLRLIDELKLTSRERRDISRGLDGTRIGLRLQSVVTPQSPRVGCELLWAMRQRKGWTQAEAARAVGVQQAQVARWERGDTWPSNERLHAFCWHLGARPEEAAALTLAEAMSTAEHPASLSLVAARNGEASVDLDQWRSYLNGLLYTSVPEDDLIDLTMLAAESRLARLAESAQSAVELVASAYGVHARLHMNRRQFRLGRHWAEKGLAEMSSHRTVFTQESANTGNALWFGNVAGICADASVRDHRPDRERAVVVVKRWLEALPPNDVGHRSWGLLCLARLLSETGRRDEAAEALLTAANEDNSPAMDAIFRRRIVAAIRAIDSGHYRSARIALVDCDSMISARSDPSLRDSVREAQRLLDRIDRASSSRRKIE